MGQHRDRGGCHPLSLVSSLTVTEKVVSLNLAMSCWAEEGGGVSSTYFLQSGIDTCASNLLFELQWRFIRLDQCLVCKRDFYFGGDKRHTKARVFKKKTVQTLLFCLYKGTSLFIPKTSFKRENKSFLMTMQIDRSIKKKEIKWAAKSDERYWQYINKDRI